MKLVEKPTINLEGITEDLADITYSLSELKEDLDYYRNVILNLQEHIKPNKVNQPAKFCSDRCRSAFNNARYKQIKINKQERI